MVTLENYFLPYLYENIHQLYCNNNELFKHKRVFVNKILKLEYHNQGKGLETKPLHKTVNISALFSSVQYLPKNCGLKPPLLRG